MSFITLTPLRYLASELADLRAANANLAPQRFALWSNIAKRRAPQPNRKATRLGGFSVCIKATKKIFFAVCNKDSNSNGDSLDDIKIIPHMLSLNMFFHLHFIVILEK